MANSLDASVRQSDSVSESISYRTDYAEAVAAEDNAIAAIKQMARDNASSLRMLWRWNDGLGGGVAHLIAQELGLRSPACVYPPPDCAPKKKVIGNALRTKVFERDAYRCVHCATHIGLTVDHILAESKGGTLAFDNLQTLCQPCNSRKGSK